MLDRDAVGDLFLTKQPVLKFLEHLGQPFVEI